jgi:hypothetical protein
MDYHEIWFGDYVIGSYSKLMLFNFFVINTNATDAQIYEVGG